MIPEPCPLSCQHARNIHRLTSLASRTHCQSARSCGSRQRSTCKTTSHVLGSAEHPFLPAWRRKHGVGRHRRRDVSQQRLGAEYEQNAKPFQVHGHSSDGPRASAESTEAGSSSALADEASLEIREQQQSLPGAHQDPEKIQRLVETAMLAAVGGVLYTLATVLKLQGYSAYVQPMPVVVAAMRWGPAAGRKTMTATCFLLLVLLGPLQSCTFLLNQGLLAATLGAFWSAQAHWAISVPAAALVRVTGTLAYIVLSSWTMNENLFALLLSNVYALLDQFNAFIGASGAPPPTVVIVVIGSMLTVNASLYTFLMHIVYAVLLRSMGYTITSIPKPVERLIFRQQVA